MRERAALGWAEALRSGRYKQGVQGRMRSGDSWDPLGVLCDISQLGEWRGDVFAPNRQHALADCFPPLCVRQWAGLRTANGRFESPTKDGAVSVEEMHEKLFMSFEQIASTIEEKWQEL